MENTQKVMDALNFIYNLGLSPVEMHMLITELAEISDRMDGLVMS